MLGRRHWWEMLMPWLHPYSDWKVRGRGKKDGRTLRPAWDAEALPPFLESLGKAGTQDLRVLAKSWHGEDRTYKSEFVSASRAFEVGKKAADKAEEMAGKTLDKYEDANGHRSWKASPRPFWWLAMLCLLEVPFNAASFRGVSDNELVAWVLALSLGVLLAILAHYFGKQLRVKLALPHLALFMILPCALIAGAHYATMRATSGSAPSFVATLGFFIAFNILFYAVATLASYWQHIPFGSEVVQTQRQLRVASDTRDRAHAAMEEAIVQRQKRFLEKQEHAAWIEQEVGRLRDVYWTANMETRKDFDDAHSTHYPKSYDRQVEVRMPDELRTLNWDNAALTALPNVTTPQQGVARLEIPLPQAWSPEKNDRLKRADKIEEIAQ
jgi:hypothetical protein